MGSSASAAHGFVAHKDFDTRGADSGKSGTGRIPVPATPIWLASSGFLPRGCQCGRWIAGKAFGL